MVPVSYRVTDVSQLKFHAQENGTCVSFKEGEWIWLAKEVARHLSFMLDVGTVDMKDIDEALAEKAEEDEVEFEVSYQLPGSDKVHKVTVKGMTETDALVEFYENAPPEYKVQLTKVEITKKV